MSLDSNASLSYALIEETVPTMLLLQYENEGDLVDSVILQHVCISGLNDFFSLVDADNFKRVVQVCNRDLLYL